MIPLGASARQGNAHSSSRGDDEREGQQQVATPRPVA
jgi:hypothetical protein